jgi:hypothetical protein
MGRTRIHHRDHRGDRRGAGAGTRSSGGGTIDLALVEPQLDEELQLPLGVYPEGDVEEEVDREEGNVEGEVEREKGDVEGEVDRQEVRGEEEVDVQAGDRQDEVDRQEVDREEEVDRQEVDRKALDGQEGDVEEEVERQEGDGEARTGSEGEHAQDGVAPALDDVDRVTLGLRRRAEPGCRVSAPATR